MSTPDLFDPCYTASWAFVVGIDRYEFAAPLQYAVSDAKGVASTLKSQFGFEDDKIISLYASDATQNQIRKRYLELAEMMNANDRLVFFFAGHGHTTRTARGDAGFLVPVDGNPESVSTLIRWNELINDAKLFPAKHVFWILDACFSGTAFRRKLPPGSTRFVEDMLKRPAWQLITSGKHDETVADGGGTRPSHSLFTSHLLDALEGKASDSHGCLTANRIMAYVYDKVATVYSSEQTPHHGTIDGEGDMIFLPHPSTTIVESSETPKEQIVESSPIGPAWADAQEVSTLENKTKGLLASAGSRILLDDFITAELRAFSARIHAIEINRASLANSESIVSLLTQIEAASLDMCKLMALVCHWGTSEHDGIVRKIVLRVADALGVTNTSSVNDALRWYSGVLITYCGTIGAASSENFERLAPLLLTTVTPSNATPISFNEYLSLEQLTLSRADIFKKINGHDRNYVPQSEFIYGRLQPTLEDLFFLGSSYELWFDWAEIIRAMVNVETRVARGEDAWGTPGRFVYRHLHRRTTVFNSMRSDARALDRNWPLAKAGLFNRSGAKFAELADKYEQEMQKLGWF